MIGGEIDQGHDFLASEMGQPLSLDRENGLKQIGAWLQDLFGGAGDFGVGQHRQRQQAVQRIEARLLAQFFQAQPVHASEKHLQLAGQPIRPKPESMVRHHHDHFQDLHLGMQLGKAGGLGPEAMLKPSFALHLHLQQHDGVLRRAALAAAWPERTIETVVRRFDLRCLKAVERIPRRIRPE